MRSSFVRLLRNAPPCCKAQALPMCRVKRHCAKCHRHRPSAARRCFIVQHRSRRSHLKLRAACRRQNPSRVGVQRVLPRTKGLKKPLGVCVGKMVSQAKERNSGSCERAGKGLCMTWLTFGEVAGAHNRPKQPLLNTRSAVLLFQHRWLQSQVQISQGRHLHHQGRGSRKEHLQARMLFQLHASRLLLVGKPQSSHRNRS